VDVHHFNVDQDPDPDPTSSFKHVQKSEFLKLLLTSVQFTLFYLSRHGNSLIRRYHKFQYFGQYNVEIFRKKV
jgi:hypothetical protein